MNRRVHGVGAAAIALLMLLTACGGDKKADATDPAVATAPQTGNVDTGQFDNLLLECDVVSPQEISDIVGGTSQSPGFFGAICRWVVSGGAGGTTEVTLNWFEWGDFNLEKRTVKRLGYETENIQVKGFTAFIARKPDRQGICGVTAKSPSRGILTWWVEHENPSGDPCDEAVKLMELVMDAAP